MSTTKVFLEHSHALQLRALQGSLDAQGGPASPSRGRAGLHALGVLLVPPVSRIYLPVQTHHVETKRSPDVTPRRCY